MLSSNLLGKLFKEEFTELLRSTKDICLDNQPQALKIEPQVNALVDIVQQLDDTLLFERENDFTKILEQLDLERDHAITGIRYGFLMNLYHPDTAKKDAAGLLLDHLEGYGKRITKLNYEAQSTVLINIVQDYKTKEHLTKALKTLGLLDWALRIDTSNETFREKYQQRITTTSAEEKISFSSLKPEAIQVYEKLANRLYAYIELDDVGDYDTIKNQLDTLGERYQQIIKRRKSAAETEEPVNQDTDTTTV